MKQISMIQLLMVGMLNPCRKMKKLVILSLLKLAFIKDMRRLVIHLFAQQILEQIKDILILEFGIFVVKRTVPGKWFFYEDLDYRK